MPAADKPLSLEPEVTWGRNRDRERMRHRFADTATRAVLAGGRLLADRFQQGDAEGTYHDTDVKAAADEASEARVLDVIRTAYPDHHVYAEESGELGGSIDDSEYSWVVDPLDGTNNFVAGMPSFATATVVSDDDGPLAGAVYAPLPDDLYVAVRGGGVQHDGEFVTASADRAPPTATVGFVIGHDVKQDGRLPVADTARAELSERVKRVISSWSPTVHWGLLARGRLDAMVTFCPDDEEQVVGELLAREADAVCDQRGDWYVAATTPAVADTAWDAIETATWN